jgi:hypothetical protein
LIFELHVEAVRHGMTVSEASCGATLNAARIFHFQRPRRSTWARPPMSRYSAAEGT